MPACPECNADVSDERRFCPRCGTELSVYATNTSDEQGDREYMDLNDPQSENNDDYAGSDPDPEPQLQRQSEGGLIAFPIEYPSRAGWFTIVGGGILFLLSFLIIPLFMILGYLVRVANAAAQGRPEPPTLDDWLGLIKDGLVVTAVLIPPGIIYSLLVVIGMEINIILYVILAVVGAYALPAIFVSYAAEKDWRAAYDISSLVELMSTRTYLFGYLIYLFIFQLIGSVVVGILAILSLLTIVGWIIIIPMLYFYWVAIDAALWGQVYNKVNT